MCLDPYTPMRPGEVEAVTFTIQQVVKKAEWQQPPSLRRRRLQDATQKVKSEFPVLDADSNADIYSGGREATRFNEATGKWERKQAWATTSVLRSASRRSWRDDGPPPTVEAGPAGVVVRHHRRECEREQISEGHAERKATQSRDAVPDGGEAAEGKDFSTVAGYTFFHSLMQSKYNVCAPVLRAYLSNA